MALQVGDAEAPALETDDLGAIRRVLEKYLYCADVADHDSLATCFTDDAALSFDVLPHTFVGGRALADWIASAHEQNQSSTTHALANTTIGSPGATVPVVSHVVANIAIPADPGYVIKVRGIRYDDDFVRTPEGWKIARRTHTPLWQFEVPGHRLVDVASS